MTRTLGAPLDVRVGDVVQLRKGHPCGGDTWTIYRIGADIGLRCATCGRRVLLSRRELERRLKRFVQRADFPADAVSTSHEAGPEERAFN